MTCIDLNHDWRFIRRRMGRRWLAGGGNNADGSRVDLPHCWNATEEFQEGIEYYRGHGSYRKVFRMPSPAKDEDAAWLLEAEGFYGTGELWLNGKHAAQLDGQYLGFSIDVGAYLRPDADNIVALRLTNRCASYVLPGIKDPDFLLYGGLSGRMRLRQASSLHVDQGSFRVFCRTATATDAEIVFACAVNNRAACDRRFTVKWIALDADGKCVAETSASDLAAMAGGRCENISGSVHIDAPRLWSPDSPYLYRVDCELLEQDRLVERESIRLGVRRAEFRPGEGFFLNGMRTFLRGCNRHESMPGFGRALPIAMHREDAALIKSLGLNFVRLSHYPQHPQFLDACDELGIMVCAELASWKSVRGGRWLRSACRQWRDMILRDRNHPSVIMWCMGNESRNRRAYLELRRIARELDPDRPVTYAENHLYRARREKTIGIPDVWGSNYELDVLEDGAAAGALNCVLVTECSNCPNAVRGNAAEELRQVETIETDLKRLEGRPCVAGFALWCFNDYATMRKKRYQRFSGIVDAWRSPKMSCALLRAMFLKEPFIRVFVNWAEDPAASAQALVARRTIHVFTNCGKAVLKINGQPVATLSGGPHIATALEFTAGELSAEGFFAGKLVSDSIIFSGSPALVSAAGAHVAHLNTGKEWGGGENQVFNLVRHMVEAGSRNTIFAPQGGELFSRAAAAGLPTKSMPAGAWLSRFSPGHMRLAQACRESGVDIIHAHDSHALDAGIAVSRQLRIPLVYTRRVASPLRRNPFSRRKYSSRNISAVIAISETVKNVFLKSGYPAE